MNQAFLLCGAILRLILDTTAITWPEAYKRIDDLLEQCGKDGWLGHKLGKAIPKQGAAWLKAAMKEHFESLPNARPPYIYPTHEGGIDLEWEVGSWYIDMEIDLTTRKGAYGAMLGLEPRRTVNMEFDLATARGWRSIADDLKRCSVPVESLEDAHRDMDRQAEATITDNSI